MDNEKKFIEEPKNNPRMGHGKGTIIDSLGDVATDLHNWAARVQAGQRLLVVGPGHRAIKRTQKLLRPIAKSFGLTLRYRFAREVKAIEVYVSPEMIRGRDIEYQMWILVTAKQTFMTEADKRMAIVQSAVGYMQYEEMVNPPLDELPEWARTMEVPV